MTVHRTPTGAARAGPPDEGQSNSAFARMGCASDSSNTWSCNRRPSRRSPDASSWMDHFTPSHLNGSAALKEADNSPANAWPRLMGMVLGAVPSEKSTFLKSIHDTAGKMTDSK